ncbi:MAG TPA: hypothetical protein VLM89_05520 [Phycisphaerae bacterium]|nr:hypothetical protein [Phycisphaerae bacterium]
MDLHTVNDLIRTSEPAGRFWRGPTLILMGLSVLLGALWADPGFLPVGRTLAFLLPQCLLVAILAVMLWDLRRQRRTGRLLEEAMEAVHLQDWPRAEATLRELLGSPIRRPMLRTQSLLALAAVAESERKYESSQAICEYILRSGLGNPLQRHTAEVALGAAMLRNGQTTDAVALIDRLRPEALPEVLRAQVELLCLFREVTMGHAEESTNRADQRRELFRANLGTRAGYGYALQAAAFDRLQQVDAARQYWHDATLLVSPQDLLKRFPELSGIAGRYPAAEYPF